MRFRTLLALAILGASQAAGAQDAAANFLMRLYLDACVPNVGQPAKVREWAARKQLQEINSPPVLKMLVGADAKSDAWLVPAAFGTFALSIRATTRACAAWAQAANPDDVEAYFRKVVTGAAQPGIDVGVVKDDSVSGPYGKVHTLIYQVSGNDKTKGGFVYTLQTAEKSGGPYQVSLQAAQYSAPDSTR